MTGPVATGGWATETVQFRSDAFTIPAFLAKPISAAAAPAILLLHEWWGLNDRIRDVARRMAQEGYVVLAPDLYARLGSKVATTPQEAANLMNAVSSQAVLRDLNAATRYLKTQPFVDPLAIGIVGFSMGGTFALIQTAHNSDLKAAVVFYGKVPPIETFRYLLCPILYHYPAKDGWVTSQEVDRLKEGFAQHGKTGEVFVYPEATHGFCNEQQPDAYRANDAKLAWQRTFAFLARYLGGVG